MFLSLHSNCNSITRLVKVSNLLPILISCIDPHTGPLVNTICNHIGWLRVPDNSSIWENATDPSAGPTVGHYELVFTVCISLSFAAEQY